MTLQEWLDKVYPVLLARLMTRAEGEVTEGKVTAYWVVDVLRIDIKPK